MYVLVHALHSKNVFLIKLFCNFLIKVTLCCLCCSDKNTDNSCMKKLNYTQAQQRTEKVLRRTSLGYNKMHFSVSPVEKCGVTCRAEDEGQSV